MCGDLHGPPEDLPTGGQRPHPPPADPDGGQAVPPPHGGLSGEGNPALRPCGSGESAETARSQGAARLPTSHESADHEI